jgi:dihydrofolate reductase
LGLRAFDVRVRTDREVAMGRIVVSEFVTLDGVMEDPGGAEGFALGGWAFRFDRGPEGDKFKLDETLEAEALLLGRVTYEGFAKAWPGRTDEAGFADKMNGMPKFVVSNSLKNPDWNNSTVVTGDIPEELRRLKERIGGNILVAGSRTLVQTLIQHNLVDEYRLMVFPTVLGTGKRLFNEGGTVTALDLSEAKPVGSGVLVLTYAATAK